MIVITTTCDCGCVFTGNPAVLKTYCKYHDALHRLMPRAPATLSGCGCFMKRARPAEERIYLFRCGKEKGHHGFLVERIVV